MLNRVIGIRRADVGAYMEANRAPSGSLSDLYPPGYSDGNEESGRRRRDDVAS
jgi:hypothetical protein